MATNREIIFALKMRNEAQQGLNSIKGDVGTTMREVQQKSDQAARSVKQLGNEAKGAGDKTKQLQQKLSATANSIAVLDGPLGGIASRFSSLSTLIGRTGLALGAFMLSVTALGRGLSGSIREQEQFERNMLRTRQIIETTNGVAGRTAEQLAENARRIARETLASTEGVMRAQQTLLTFRGIRGDIFDEAIEAANDMAATLGGNLEGSIMQVAKALENPVQGINALARSGTVFTDAQKEMVKQMVETGRTADAQRFILAELAAQYGGVARREAQGLAGAQDTLAQSIQEVRIAFADVLDLGNRLAAILNGLASALDFVRDNMGRLVAIVQAAALAAMVAFRGAIIAATVALGKMAAAILFTRTALIRAGWGIFIVLLGEIIFQITELSRKMGGFGNVLRAVRDLAVEVGGRIGEAFRVVGLSVGAVFNDIKARVAEAMQAGIENVVEFGNKAVGSFRGAFEAIKVIWGNLPAAIGDMVIRAANNLIEALEEMLKKATSGIDAFLTQINAALEFMGSDRRVSLIGDMDIFGRIDNRFEGAAEDTGRLAREAFARGFNTTTFSTPDTGLTKVAVDARVAAGTMREAANALASGLTRPLESWEAFRVAAEDATTATEEFNATLSGNGTGTGDGGGTGAASEAMKKALELVRSAIEQQTPRVEQLRQQYLALSNAFALVRDQLTPAEIDLVTAALQRQADVLSGTIGSGIREGARNYADSLKSMSEEIADFAQSQFRAMEDTLTEFFMTGKMGFREFANAAIKELMRILVRQWIIAPIAGFLGFGSAPVGHVGYIAGQAATVTRNLPRYHTGGIGSGEQTAVIRRGEAIMPTARLSDGTLGIRADGIGGANITNVVNVKVEGGNAAAGGTQAQQEELGRTISRQITVALQEEMSRFTQREMRPGGMLYKGGM